MRTSLFALGAALVVACSAPTSTEEVGSGEHASLSDAVSIVRRPDGRFDVFCRGKDGAPDFTQTVEASAIHDDSVCSPAAPPGPRVVAVGDRALTIPYGANGMLIDEWGADTWEGYASFDVVVAYPASGRIVDGSGATYPLSSTRTRYERLPTPIKLYGTLQSYGTGSARLDLFAASVEVTKTLPIAPSLLSAKYAGASTELLKTLGRELPNTPVTLTATARFYANFTNANACSRAMLIDVAGQIVTLEPGSPSRRASLTAPVRVAVGSTCVSSRLAAPENADADVDVEVSRIEIGAPTP